MHYQNICHGVSKKYGMEGIHVSDAVPAIFLHLNAAQLDQCCFELFLQTELVPVELCQSEISDHADPVCICLFHQLSFFPLQVLQA